MLRSEVRVFSLAAALLVAGAAAVGCSSESQGSDDPSGLVTSMDTTAADAGPPPNGPVASSMEQELVDLGLDPKALPALDTLDEDTLHGVMQTFTRSLGVQCSGCHDTSDFSKPTKQKKTATNMWNLFTRDLAMKAAADGASGGALYCDSCHQGKAKFLQRSDHHALADWMTANFVGKLQRADGQRHDCSSCHGSPFKGDIFKDLWHVSTLP